MKTILSMHQNQRADNLQTLNNLYRDDARFNKELQIAPEEDQNLTIGEFLTVKKYPTLFKENYLLPMVSAIWSMGLESCMDFPLPFFVRFFENHGLLNVVNRPQWYTYLVTLNQDICEEHILGTHTYNHPVFTQGAIRAQQRRSTISGKNRSDFCGTFLFNGFHEDRVKSALRVCTTMEVLS